MGVLVFGVSGMHCGSCARALERALANDSLVGAVSVNQALGLASIQSHALDDLALARLFQQRAESLGYRATEISPSAWRAERIEQRMRKMIQLGCAVVGGMWIMLLSIPEYANISVDPTAQLSIAIGQGLLAVLLLFTASKDTWVMAWRGLHAGRFGIDALIASGHAAAIALSLLNLWQDRTDLHFDALAMLCFAQCLARYIEASVAADIARSIVPSRSKAASVQLSDGSEQEINTLRADTVYILVEGAEVPVDSVLLDGESLVDTSAHSGESEPVLCRAMQAVLAGSRLAEANLPLRATVDFGQSRRDRMLHDALVGLAAKVPAQRRLDVLAQNWGWLLLLALVLRVVLGLYSEQPAEEVFYAVLSIVLLGCPCALALAWVLPWAALGARLPNGVKVQHYGVLARLADIDSIVFDKTATLTEPLSLRGKLSCILQSIPADKTEYFQTALNYSSHPSVRALLQGATAMQQVSVAEVLEIPGKGLEITYKDGEIGLLGHSIWLKDSGVKINEGENLSYGEICFALTGELVVRLPLSERTRLTAQKARKELCAMGFKQYLFSGDRNTAVQRFCASSPTGFVEAHAQMSPDQKGEAVTALRDSGSRILMVGDGANDIGAGAAADLSLGFAGSQGDGNHLDIRFENADLLGLLPSLMCIARQTRHVSAVLQLTPLVVCAGLLLLAQFSFVSPFILSATMTLNITLIAIISQLNAHVRSVSCLEFSGSFNLYEQEVISCKQVFY